MPEVFVLDVPEFRALVEAARTAPGCQVDGPRLGYWRLKSSQPLAFRRKDLGFKPAVWHGALTGGLVGAIGRFDNDELVIGEAAP